MSSEVFDDNTIQTMSEVESPVLTIQEASSSSAEGTENSYDSSSVFINESTVNSETKNSERDDEASYQGELIHYQTEENSHSSETESESSFTTSYDSSNVFVDESTEEHEYETISSENTEEQGDQVGLKCQVSREGKKISWVSQLIHEITSFRGGGLVRAYELGRML